MEEEPKKEEPKEEPKEEKDPTFLEKVTAVKDDMGKIVERHEKAVVEMKELKANEILSGKIDASGDDKKKEPETDSEFASRMLE